MRITPKHAAVVALLAGAPWMVASAAEDRSDDNSTKVFITGEGNAPQPTQVITMQAGVISFATDPADAWRDNYRAMARLRSTLRGEGIPEKDIRTASLGLSPSSQYENEKNIKGFEVRHTVTVIFHDIDRTGAVLDALVDAGAKQIDGPRFSWEAGKPALQVARAAAIRDANQRAEFYARSLGLRVKRVVSMRDSGGYASQQPAALVMRNESGGGTQVAMGEDTVRLSIQGEYELVR